MCALAFSELAVAVSPPTVPSGEAPSPSVSREATWPPPVPTSSARTVWPLGAVHVVVSLVSSAQYDSTQLPDTVDSTVGVVWSARFSVSPAQVDITLTGTLLAVEKAKSALQPVVKVSGNDTKPRDGDVVVEGLPPGIGVKISPERVKLTVGK